MLGTKLDARSFLELISQELLRVDAGEVRGAGRRDLPPL